MIDYDSDYMDMFEYFNRHFALPVKAKKSETLGKGFKTLRLKGKKRYSCDGNF